MARILLVEDYTNIVVVYKAALMQAGYQVEVAKDGAEATYLADKNHYDLIILDMLLPYKSGLDFLKSAQLKDKEHPPKVIAVSNVPTPALVSETVSQGVDTFLEKAHITPKILLQTVEHLLRPPKQEE